MEAYTILVKINMSSFQKSEIDIEAYILNLMENNERKEREMLIILYTYSPIHTILEAWLKGSWKICSLAVNGQSFLVIDGYLLNS